MSWCELGLTYDLAVEMLIFKILSGAYLGVRCDRNVYKLILGRDIGWGCRYTKSECDLDFSPCCSDLDL